jgi:tRNA (mo5U34)-methyltransferase
VIWRRRRARVQLAERIAAFPQWHYEFDLDGLKTPVHVPAWANRHRQRLAYIMPPLVAAAGGTLQDRRVLDLGCNAGFWSLAAIEAGAEFVLGVDARRMHIDQAELVFETRGVRAESYHFVQGNVLGLDQAEHGPFDVVLCLGLLYHVPYPFELMEICARARELAVVDTALVRTQEPILRVEQDVPLEDPRSAVGRALVMRPSARAVRDMAVAVGFESVTELEPHFDDYTGARDYENGERRAFLCVK